MAGQSGFGFSGFSTGLTCSFYTTFLNIKKAVVVVGRAFRGDNWLSLSYPG
jgi:hypothetical protein